VDEHLAIRRLFPIHRIARLPVVAQVTVLKGCCRRLEVERGNVPFLNQ
jgi:hypothetical protein